MMDGFHAFSNKILPGRDWVPVWKKSSSLQGQLFARGLQSVRLPHPKSIKMSYDSKFGVLFIARIETIVTAIQNNDLIVSAPMVRLSNAPPPIT